MNIANSIDRRTRNKWKDCLVIKVIKILLKDYDTVYLEHCFVIQLMLMSISLTFLHLAIGNSRHWQTQINDRSI